MPLFNATGDSLIRKYFALAVLTGLLITLTACSVVEDSTATTVPSPTPSEVVVATTVPISTVEPTPVVVASATATPMATPVPTGTAVPTVVPTAGPTVTAVPTSVPTSVVEPPVTPTLVPTVEASPTAAPQPDLHGDDSTTATTVQQGNLLAGRIEPIEDVDWFTFDTTAGSTYRISVDGADGDLLSDPLLQLVDSDGRRVLIVDDDRGAGAGALVDWVAPASQAYYLNVLVGSTGVAGSYTVLITEEVSDHGNGMTSATDIAAGDSLVGRIEAVGDRDWFAFEALAGSSYEVVVTRGTLAGSSLRLFDTDGVRRLAVGGDSVEWLVQDSGVYYVSVGGSGGASTGSYEISLLERLDDGGDSFSSPRIISPGSGIAGVLESTGDQDWFVFSTTRGVEYRFFLPSAPVGTRLHLFDQNGTTRLVGNTGSRSGAPTIVWTAPASAHYFVAVGTPALGGVGNYVLAVVTLSDDYADSSSGASAISMGGLVSGNLETLGDEDWFSFAATEGVLYQFSTDLSSLSDSTLTLLETDGVTRIMTDDDGGEGGGSAIAWMAPASRTYYLKVRSPGGLYTGTYNVAVGATMDVMADASPGALELVVNGSQANSSIETAGDVDWYKFAVQANTEYTITLTSNGLRTARMDLFSSAVNEGVLQADSGLASGTTLYSDTDAVTGIQTVRFKDWSAYGTGTYFVSVESYLIEGIGSYAVSVSTAGVDSRPFTGIFDTVASASGYGGGIVDLPLDVHGNDAGDATVLPVGSTVSGRIMGGDKDWFAFSAVGGQVYRFETTSISLDDPDLKLYGIDGSTELASDLDSGEGKAARLEWTAPTTGTFWVEIYSRFYSGNDRNGSYWLTISTEVDAQGEDSTSAEALQLGVSGANHVTTSGDLETRGDSDWFAFSAELGGTYRIEANGVSLDDPDLKLYDVDGVSQLVYDIDSGEGMGSRIEWVAPAGGTYWIEVRSRSYSGNDGVGGYVLMVSGAPDDHAVSFAGATLVDVGVAVSGDLETRGDADRFAFAAVEGGIYRLSATSVSLADPDLALFDVGGVTRLDYDLDSGAGASAWLEWVAPATGTYFVEVSTRSYSGNPGVGTYRLMIASGSDDHGGDSSGATLIDVGDAVAGYVTVAGDLEMRGDTDWFSFRAVEGWVYRLSAASVSLGDPDLGLFDVDGLWFLSWDIDSGEGTDAFMEWTAEADGLYFVEVGTRSYSGNTRVGAYTLTVSGGGG